MYHESNAGASTSASPVLSPPPSSEPLSTQQWPSAAVPTESAQIANSFDRAEAPRSAKKRPFICTALQTRVGLRPAPLASSRPDTSRRN